MEWVLLAMMLLVLAAGLPLGLYRWMKRKSDRLTGWGGTDEHTRLDPW